MSCFRIYFFICSSCIFEIYTQYTRQNREFLFFIHINIWCYKIYDSHEFMVSNWFKYHNKKTKMIFAKHVENTKSLVGLIKMLSDYLHSNAWVWLMYTLF